MLTFTRAKLAFCLGVLLTTIFCLPFLVSSPQEEQGETLVRTVALAVQSKLLAQDVLGLQTLSRELIARKDIVSIAIYDVEGQLLAGASDAPDLNTPTLARFTTELSLMNASAGTVEIGLHKSDLETYGKILLGFLTSIALLPLIFWFTLSSRARIDRVLGSYLIERRVRIESYRAERESASTSASMNINEPVSGSTNSNLGDQSKPFDTATLLDNEGERQIEQSDFFSNAIDSDNKTLSENSTASVKIFWHFNELRSQLSSTLFQDIEHTFAKRIQKVATLYAAICNKKFESNGDGALSMTLNFNKENEAESNLFSSICASVLVQQLCQDINDVPLHCTVLVDQSPDNNSEALEDNFPESLENGYFLDHHRENDNSIIISAKALITSGVGEKIDVDTRWLSSGWSVLKSVKAPYSQLLQGQASALSNRL